jgi:hypothetical protein
LQKKDDDEEEARDESGDPITLSQKLLGMFKRKKKSTKGPHDILFLFFLSLRLILCFAV